MTKEELAIRSSIGFYAFSAPGCNEGLIQTAGLCLLHAADTTENTAQIAQRWHEARQRRKPELIVVEGAVNFEELHDFSCAHRRWHGRGDCCAGST